MPLYESTFIARPDISSQQVDGLAEQFREILTEAGGQVAKTEYWGLRSLAYRIKKNRKGHYYFMNIDAPPEAIEAMEHTLRINEDVIRYLTVRVEEHDPNPAPLTQSRGRGRDGRGGRGGRWESRGGEGRRREDGERGERRERDESRERQGSAPAEAAPAADAPAKAAPADAGTEPSVSDAAAGGEASSGGAEEKSDG
jgi:small subunit ribosomal protein S6